MKRPVRVELPLYSHWCWSPCPQADPSDMWESLFAPPRSWARRRRRSVGRCHSSPGLCLPRCPGPRPPRCTPPGGAGPGCCFGAGEAGGPPRWRWSSGGDLGSAGRVGGASQRWGRSDPLHPRCRPTTGLTWGINRHKLLIYTMSMIEDTYRLFHPFVIFYIFNIKQFVFNQTYKTVNE